MMEQAAGRIDRMNTKYIDLWYYHLTSKSSIELAIRRALVEKKQFNEMRFVGRFNFKEEKYESSKSSYDVRERASEICRSRIN